jgi:hypothetical protein
VRRFADCFIDRRDPRYVEHQVETLVGQRIFGLALGYEEKRGVTKEELVANVFSAAAVARALGQGLVALPAPGLLL